MKQDFAFDKSVVSDECKLSWCKRSKILLVRLIFLSTIPVSLRGINERCFVDKPYKDEILLSLLSQNHSPQKTKHGCACAYDLTNYCQSI